MIEPMDLSPAALAREAERLFAMHSRISVFDALSAVRDAATQQERERVLSTLASAMRKVLGDEETEKLLDKLCPERPLLAALRGHHGG